MFKNLMFTFQSPAYYLVTETALRNRGLIVINLLTNFLSAILEGSTLGLVYLAISYLSESSGVTTGQTANNPLLRQLETLLPLPPAQMFLLILGAAVFLQAFLSMSNYANKVAAASLSAKAQPYVTGKVFEQILSFSYGCVSRYKVGDLVMFTSDAAEAVDQQITSINNLIVGLSFSVMYLIVIVQLSPILAIAATLLTLLVALVQYKLIPRLRVVIRRVVESRVALAKYMTEGIQALRLLHTFGTQISTINQCNNLLNKTQIQLQKRAFFLYLPEPILEMLPMLALAILAASAVLMQGAEAAILPTLMTFLLALQRLALRLKSTAGTFTLLIDNSGRMHRLATILDGHDKDFEESGETIFPGLQSDIQFEHVSLSYGNNDDFALKELTFSIPRHRVIALVGESGAGKSSIVDLLLGLFQPSNGQIRVNGQLLSSYRLKDWRKQIGVVSQDTFIFNENILENLRYGRPEASFDEVVNCAKAAQAHEFIMALPDSYETTVGERGYRLSGGQRQRLALARALVKDPSILILDEATSALDSESEKLIQEAIEEFQKNKTVIVVAHRLSTISKADQILVLEQGEIVEQGSHSQLLQWGGRYARYWQLQSSVVLKQ